MCFYKHIDHPIIKIAEEDIICWKLVKRTKFKTTFHSSVKNFKYTKGKKYKIYLFNKTNYSGLDYWHNQINRGFHSYTNRYFTRGKKYSHHSIVKCIIPKGSLYWYNPTEKQYCSNQIIIKEKSS